MSESDFSIKVILTYSSKVSTCCAFIRPNITTQVMLQKSLLCNQLFSPKLKIISPSPKQNSYVFFSVLVNPVLFVCQNSISDVRAHQSAPNLD